MRYVMRLPAGLHAELRGNGTLVVQGFESLIVLHGKAAGFTNFTRRLW